jgi:hypothetical protein
LDGGVTENGLRGHEFWMREQHEVGHGFWTVGGGGGVDWRGGWRVGLLRRPRNGGAGLPVDRDLVGLVRGPGSVVLLLAVAEDYRAIAFEALIVIDRERFFLINEVRD